MSPPPADLLNDLPAGPPPRRPAPPRARPEPEPAPEADAEPDEAPAPPRRRLPLPGRGGTGTGRSEALKAAVVVVAGLWAIALVLALLVLLQHTLPPRPGPTPPNPSPVPDSRLVDLGREHCRDLVAARAAAWRLSAQQLREGKTVQEAEDAGESEFNTTRFGTFETKVAPTLKAINPEGEDLTDPAKREALARALDDLATGADGQRPHKPRGPPFVAKLMGWVDRELERHRLAETLPQRTMTEAMPGAVGADGGPENVYLYKAWKEVLGEYPAYPRQEIGDCTSFGSGHAIDLLQCIDLATSHGSKDQYRETCTEAIYGMGREIAHMLGGGDGCYGVAVSKALTEFGAVPREAVGPYSGQRAKQWGRSGVPADIKSKAAEHKLGAATLVTTLDEADASLRNGYPFIVCSNQGFTLQRDQDGVCQPRGSWAHCMFVSARRVRGGRVQYCICQSWGPSMPSGPTTDDQPPFSFWADARVIARMIGGRDSLAFSKFSGFVARPVPVRWTYAGFGDELTARPVSADSNTLVDRLTPEVRAALEARKPEILENAGNFARREAIKLAWPTLLNEVPTLIRTAVDLIKKELCEPPPAATEPKAAPTTRLEILPMPAAVEDARPLRRAA